MKVKQCIETVEVPSEKFEWARDILSTLLLCLWWVFLHLFLPLAVYMVLGTVSSFWESP